MPIYADPPRKYSKLGLKWSHLSSPDLKELEAFAKANGLKRKDRKPFIHYDVTEEELSGLRDVVIVNRRMFLHIMKPFKQPRKRCPGK
jgi:hypothetical protein